MRNQIKVNVNLDTKAVDQVELTNDRPDTLKSFTKLRDIIDVFGKQVKRRLRNPRKQTQ